MTDEKIRTETPHDLAHGRASWDEGDVDAHWLEVAEPAALVDLSAPGSPAEQPRVVRRFMAVLLGLALVVVAAVSAFNYVVDPTGDFGGEAVTERMDVRIKLDLIEAWKTAPDILVLGPSPMMKYDPKEIRRVTGKSAFNAALSGARPSASFAIASYVAEQHPDDMPELVIGINPFAFRTGRDGFLRQDDRLKRQVDRGRMAPEEDVLERYGQLASLQLAGSSVKAMLSRSGGAAGALLDAVQADYRKVSDDGFLLYEYPDDAKTVARLTEEHTGNYARALDRWIAEGGDPDAVQLRYLARAIKVANDHGGRPIVVMTPTNPIVFDRLRDTGFEDQEQRMLDAITKLQGRLDFRIVDLRRAETAGLEVDDFYDASHITKRGATKSIEAIYGDATEG